MSVLQHFEYIPTSNGGVGGVRCNDNFHVKGELIVTDKATGNLFAIRVVNGVLTTAPVTL